MTSDPIELENFVATITYTHYDGGQWDETLHYDGTDCEAAEERAIADAEETIGNPLQELCDRAVSASIELTAERLGWIETIEINVAGDITISSEQGA